MGSGENNIAIKMDMSISGTVNPGDYFTIEESDTLHYNMLQPDALNYNDILTADKSEVLAKVVFGEGFNSHDGSNKTVHYVFTDAVSGMNDLSMNLNIDRSVNMNYAPNNQSYNFGITIGSQNLSQNIPIRYDSPAVRGLTNVDANYLYTNDTTGQYHRLPTLTPIE